MESMWSYDTVFSTQSDEARTWAANTSLLYLFSPPGGTGVSRQHLQMSHHTAHAALSGPAAVGSVERRVDPWGTAMTRGVVQFSVCPEFLTRLEDHRIA